MFRFLITSKNFIGVVTSEKKMLETIVMIEACLCLRNYVGRISATNGFLGQDIGVGDLEDAMQASELRLISQRVDDLSREMRALDERSASKWEQVEDLLETR